MSEPPAGERLLTGYSGRLLLLIALGTAAAFLGRNIFGPLLPAIIEDLAITSSQAGVALTVMWVAIALTQYPGGRMADQLSYKTILIAGMATIVAGFVLLIRSASYPGFVLGLAVMGLGGGLFTPASYAQLAALFRERRGQAFGIYTASIDVGSALAGGVAVVVLAMATWRLSFVPVAAVLGAVAIALHVLHRGSYAVSRPDLEVRHTARRIFGNRRVRWALAAYVLSSAVFQGVLGFLPAFLQFAKGFSPTLAGNAFVGFFVVGMVTRLVAGHLGDRFGYVRVAAGALFVEAAGLALLLAAGSMPVTVAGIVVLAAGMTGFPPVTNAYVMDSFPDASMGGDYGAFRSLFILLGSVGPAYIGFLADRTDYVVAFLGLGPFVLGAFLVMLRLARRP